KTVLEQPPLVVPALVEDMRTARPHLRARAAARTAARRLVSIAALAAIDLGGLALGLYAALVLRALLFEPKPILYGVLWRDGAAEWLPFLGLVTVLVFWRAGLYSTRELREGNPGRILGCVVLVAALTFAFSVGTGHHFETYGLFPTAIVLTTVAIVLLRSSYEVLTGSVLRIAGVSRRALLVGEGEQLAQLRRALGTSRAGIAYEFVGTLPPGSAELPAVLASQQLDELIVADAGLDEVNLLALVEEAHRRGVRVRVAPRTTELLVDRGEYVPGQGVPLFELRPPVFVGTDWLAKRAFDLVVGALIVVVGSPLWLAIAAAIKLTSRGPVLYGDARAGLGEQPFRMWKFRTMVAGAAERQPELERLNEATGPLFKIRDDPRVTRVGRLLRRLSLDEVPNVLNVLRGEMSLVGPRPLPLRDFELLEEWHRKRYLVLPGMTGLWQIAGRSELAFDDLVRLDFYYLDNWSIWLDVTILLRTPPAVFRRRGAF
ncbi:MAG TPA: sugar transferase, partial [Gaiellaceae bacterium]|nr:sugar transferase [Gaiellaceae bacterium]